jgi:hypothetical protein
VSHTTTHPEPRYAHAPSPSPSPVLVPVPPAATTPVAGPAGPGGPGDTAASPVTEVESARSRAGAAVVLGAVGLFFLNIVLGPLAVVLGVTALRRGAPRAWALTGIALGIADLIVITVLSTLLFHNGGLVWLFGS